MPHKKHQQLFFLHIPKTAGTSVRKMLEVRIGLRSTCLILDGAELRASLSKINDFELVTGHLWYQLRDILNKDCFVVTFLRDPLERAISAFHYFKTLSREELERHLGKQSEELWASLRADSIGTFVEKHHAFARRELGERQTADLCRSTAIDTCESLSDLDFQLDDLALEIARTNLAACNFIGITERMDASMALLDYQLGWDFNSEILEVNKSVRPKLNELDLSTKDKLVEVCRRDIQLYEYGSQLFEQRWRKVLTKLLEQNRKDAFSLASYAPPKSVHFTFDQGLVDRFGFYDPEYSGERWVAWTGPTERCGLILDVNTSVDLKVLVQVAATYDIETFEGLRFWVDGKPVGSVMREILTHELIVPANFCRESSRLKLEMQSKVICPAELSPSNHDKRMVGAALHGVVIEPIGVATPRKLFGLLGGKRP